MGVQRHDECVVRVGVEHAACCIRVVSFCVIIGVIFGVEPMFSLLVQGFFFLLQMLTVSLHTEVSCAHNVATFRPSTQCDLPTLPLSRVPSLPLVPTLTQPGVYIPQLSHPFPTPNPALHLETLWSEI